MGRNMESLEPRCMLAVGLVAAYGFDEGSGTSTADASGTNNGAAISNATWIATGKYGKALQFNGTNSVVTIADSASLDLTTGLTLEAWVYTTAARAGQVVISKAGPNLDHYSLHARSENGLPHTNVYVAGNYQEIDSAAIASNTWVHLAATYDGQTQRLFVNGVSVNQQTFTGTIATSTGALTIGNGMWNEPFQGMIDEVRVYNRALTQAEIQQDMNAPVTPPSGDVTPPTVTAVTPLNGAASVAATVNLTATFSEPMNASTINSGTVELRDPNNNIVAAAITYNATTRVVTLDPTSNLASFPNAFYTATVKSGSGGVKDAAGNALASPFTWSFTTGTATFQDNVVFSGLTQPTRIQFAPDGRVFVAEKGGLIKVFDNLTDTTATIFADLRTQVHNYWDKGLLGMALDPQFPTRPYVYVLYSYDGDIGGPAPKYGTAGQTSDPGPNATTTGIPASSRLSRLTANGNVMTGSEFVLVHDWFSQFYTHSIGTVAFGPDGALYAGGGDGAQANYADFGQTGGNPGGDPPNEGGALRSQDLLSSGDPVTLDGSIIRINPDTGAALPSNPLFSNPDANAKRIIAHGLRNPYRFTFRAGTNQLWIGDVGWADWEEINRINDVTDSTVENFGWPAYEGAGRQGGFDGLNLPLLENLYNTPNAVTAPAYTYAHSGQVVPGSGEPTGNSSISGLQFYTGGAYPSVYDGALFFSDYSRNRVYVAYRAANGEPDLNNRAVVATASGPVDLMVGPGGELYYPDLNTGAIHRLRYVGANRPPVAVISANPLSGSPPLTVNFSAAGSSDSDAGNTITYAWDLDNDGAFDDSTAVAPSYTFTTSGSKTVRLQVTDNLGLASIASLVINVGNSAPNVFIDLPLTSLTWKVGDVVSFSGHATDTQDGNLAASRFTWSLIMHHGTHTHPVQDFAGVLSGSFVAPDHEYPAFLELKVTATDSGGLQSTASVNLQPQTVNLNFATSPGGLQLAVNGSTAATPFSRTVIVGSSNSVSAVSPQVLGSTNYTFSSWSDGGALTHNLIAGAAATTYTATFTPVAAGSGLVAAYNFEEASGSTALDVSGTGNNGTISGATRIAEGRFGKALSFTANGHLVTIPDAASLDLTNGMTLQAWVYTTSSAAGQPVMSKAGSDVDRYSLHARSEDGLPHTHVYAANDYREVDAAAIAINSWVHLAATYDGASLRLYANGVLVNQLAGGGAIATSNNALTIGNSMWGEWFRGRIDDVRIYNRALSATEIQQDMNVPVAASSQSQTLALTAVPPQPPTQTRRMIRPTSAVDLIGIASARAKFAV